MNKIEIGMLTKPQGLKGEFRVKHKMEAIKVFFDLKQVEINRVTYDVLKVVDRGGFFILKTKQLTDINQIEPLRTAKVYAYVSEEVANDVNHNLGYKVVADGVELGTIVDLQDTHCKHPRCVDGTESNSRRQWVHRCVCTAAGRHRPAGCSGCGN